MNGSGTIAGWGQTGEEEWGSDNLLKADVNVQNLDECAKNYTNPNIAGDEGALEHFPSSSFCASKPSESKDSCQGDSGGPFFQFDLSGRAVVRGIVSFGIGCARAELPGVYTNIALFIDWITNKVKNN